MIMKQKERIQWLGILRGLNILLVIMVHVQLVDISTGENHSFCNALSFPFHPIRMPLFIFISGGLLYLSRIRKNISTKALYKDKFQRIMIPFVFFVIVYYLIKATFNQFAKTPIDLSWSNFLESFIYYRGHSSQPLWFLAVLMFLMLMYPLFRYLCDNKYRMIAFLLFCCGIFFIDTDLESRWNVFYILEVQHYLVYFFFGIFFFRFELYKYIENIGILLVLVLLYAACYYFSLGLLTSFIGISMMCALCLKIGTYMPKLFSSFREYIFQIYLMSLPFQNFVELILWKKLFYNEEFVYVFYMLNVLVGLFIPVIISKLVERCNIKFVRLCFGLQ
jgi:fucose 4-O-acetylase-like acetyltransferase